MRSLHLGLVASLAVLVFVPACSSENGAASSGGTSGEIPEGGSTSDGSISTSDGSTPSTDGASAEAGPSCTDKSKNGDETDVDCGGSCATKCKALGACKIDGDCTTMLVCVKGVCAAATSTDGLKNGNETDIDCGGDTAPACDPTKDCKVAADCKEKVCDGATKKCLEATPTDSVKNGNETDVDCGGGAPAPSCDPTKACKVAADCSSFVCTAGVCKAPLPNDGVKNGNETDIDCGGGPPAAACGTGKTCVDGPTDCESYVCDATCKAATGTDGVKNGNESDVDCGGTNTGAGPCAAGLACNGHTDCASNGCDYNGLCAIERSCTKRLGGDTCGVGEVGAAGAAHESCCMQAPLSGSAVKMDKYHVTAGRMRTFIERVSGNVRAFAAAQPGWNAAWSPYVPSTVAEANTMLGPYWNNAPNDADVATNNWSKRSCQPNFFGGHTYFTGDDPDYNATQLDPKALNCVGWHLAKAFCMWDHGRLPTTAEVSNAFRNGGANTYPWQWQDASAYDPNEQDSRLNHQFNYGFPGVPRRVSGTVQNIAWFISPPGRFPDGRNANGVDIAGNLIHWVDNIEYGFTWTLSWERHGVSLGTSNWKTSWPGEPNGYYAIGFRCVHD